MKWKVALEADLKFYQEENQRISAAECVDKISKMIITKLLSDQENRALLVKSDYVPLFPMP